MQLLTEKAEAYVYHGEWVAECPRCPNVEFLFTKRIPSGPRIVQKPFFTCSNCGLETVIVWPPTELMARLVEVLNKRPDPDTRNWYPADHPVAVKFRVPHGQSPDELRAENHDHGVEV